MEFKPVRNYVQYFAQDMERVLRNNDHKNGWQDMTYQQILNRLEDEVDELRRAIKNEKSWQDILDEAVDVANFSMFIASKCYNDINK